ncbi:MAG: AAA family ATPase [Veillonellaceae bacterium]|nr:AAA family ATPase [Veillonellaceae bacterium]
MVRTVKEDLVRYRGKGVPLVAICTADEHVLEANIPLWLEEAWREKAKTKKDGPPEPMFVGWDCVTGPYALTRKSTVALQKMLGDKEPADLLNPVDLMLAAKNLPSGSMLIVRGGHKILQSWGCVQAIANLRDPFKGDFRMLVLLGPDFQLPVEIAKNTALLDEALPDEEARANIVTRLFEDNGMAVPKEMPKIVQATHGLPPFTIEQAAALSVIQGKLDIDVLWKRWKQAVNAVKGLRVLNSQFKLDDIGGLAGIKDFAQLLMAGENPPDCIVFIDEIEKALAGASGQLGDSSGVSQDILGTLLSWMEESNATGLIAVGPPGAGKSLSAQAIGSIGPVPTIALDIGGLKGSYVGESEQNTRDAMRTLASVAKRHFFIATCNGLSGLPPELKRRFRYGIWFFDLPSPEERAAIWKIHLKRTGITKGELPDDDGWTGAEIRTCCDLARDLKISPKEAATWIAPVSRSMVEQLASLRSSAEGRWLSASAKGLYHRVEPQERIGGRKIGE